MDEHEGIAAHTDREPRVATLIGAHLPADRGLSSLGLLMRLGGTLYLGFMLLGGITLLFADLGTNRIGHLMLFFSASAVRSGIHRGAGSDLMYGTPAGSQRDPFAGTRLYIMVALSHTLLCAWLLQSIFGSTAILLSVLALLAAWPVTLAIVIRLRPMRALADTLPRSEDMGLEGASVLMLVLGVMGTLVSALFLYNSFTQMGSGDGFTWIALLFLGGILVVRSVMHVMAGKLGLSGADRASAAAAVRRYIYMGKLSAAAVGVVGSITIMRVGGIFFSLLWIGALVGFLLIWPLILDQFMDRYDIEVGMGAGQHRAPDAGLTGLGWLLLALGSLNLVSAVSQIVLDPGASLSLVSSIVPTTDAWAMASVVGRSPWLFLPVVALQLWAAVELCSMSVRARLAATLYGVVTTVLTAYLFWPVLSEMRGLHEFSSGFSGQGGFTRVAQLALALLIPVATVILANLEGFSVQARARYRDPGDGQR